MEGALPLAAAELQEIEGCLDQGQLEQAQLLLARAGENPALELGVSYLATRLLHLKGKLDDERVCERLRDLLVRSGPFPEASRLLARLEANAAPARPSRTVITPVSVRSTQSAAPIAGDAPTQTALPRAVAEQQPSSRRPLLPVSPPEAVEIPGAPRLPTARAHPEQPRPGPTSTPPRWSSAPAPAHSPLPSPRLSVRPSSAPEMDPESRTSWRARAYGLEPAVSTTPPPRARRTSPVPRGAGRYNFVNTDQARESQRLPEERVAVLGPGAQSAAGRRPLDTSAFGVHRAAAQKELDQEAWHAIGTLSDPRDPEQLARAASGVLSHNGLTHWFAPFDRSLYGLQRFDLALGVLTGGNPSQLGPATLSLLGAYLGETLRHCQRGSWRPAADTLEHTVSVGAFSWKPHRIIADVVGRPSHPPLLDRIGAGLAAEGTAPWLVHQPSPPPRVLWTHTPLAEDFPELAAALADTPLGQACAGPLDGSLGSLDALEPVAERIARSAAPLRGSEPWLVRLCVLLGAYVGEVVRRQVGGSWHTAPGGPREESYALRLSSGFEAEPVAALRERIKSQNGVRLVGYAHALVRK